MNGYIIESFNNMGNAYTCKRLVNEASKRNVNLSIVGVHDVCDVNGVLYNQNHKIDEVSFVINRYKWGKCKDRINFLAQRSYNPLNEFNIYINKYEQLKRIKSDAFLIPKYLLSSAQIEYAFLREHLGEKVVAKGLENSMGREIYLLEKEADFCKLKEAGLQKEWLFEEFIENSYGRDVRVYSIRGEVVACMTRKSDSDFRANVALGANVKEFPVSDEIRKIAKDIFLQTKLDFVGIDLLFGKEQFYFCEINVMPGLEGIESATKVNVAGKMMDMICGDFRND